MFFEDGFTGIIDEPKHPVRATETTIRVIEALAEVESIGVTGLADELDIGKSTAHNHLSTLRTHGYVVKEGSTYRLGLQFLDLGGTVRHRTDLYRAAKPHVDELAERTGDIASLAIKEEATGRYLYRAKGEAAVDIDRHVGQQTYLTSTGLGKAILAFVDEDERDEIIERRDLPAFTERSITGPDDLRSELAAVRERGYAVDDEERLRGLRCIAAPIRTDDSRLGSISVAGPTSRMRDERFYEELPDLVTNVANIIELNLREP